MGDFGVVRRRWAGIGLTAVAVAAAGMGVAVPASAGTAGIAGAGAPDAVPGSYIVVLRDGQAAAPSALAARYGGKVEHVYSATITGYAATMSERDARRAAADPAVRYVAQNRWVHASEVQPDPPSWGLDRVDQRNLPLDQTYTYSVSGANVNAYIIDTGIRASHHEFGGRVKPGIDTVDNDNDPSDCMGHGTHVAGTVGGRTFGIAKNVTLWAVRVLNCKGSGTDAQVIAGVDWVTAHAVKPAVANMSLGGEATPALDEAVQRSIASGITYGIAAGNSRDDACDYSPARVPEALTVGATYLDDTRASFSNIGPCLDVFAPGLNITSAWIGNDDDSITVSGTSMAAPHVVGVAALYLSNHPDATPQQVSDALLGAATPNKVTDPGTGSPNRLLYVDSGITPPPPPPGCGKRTNDSNVKIPDAGMAVGTVIRIAECAGNAAKNIKVTVHVKHPHRGDLRVDLVGPDGTAYRLKNNSPVESGSNIDQTYTVDASKQLNNGAWVIQVQDRSEGDEGYLDSWTLDLRRKK
jgi:subtilisin family serine protease